MIKEVVGLDPRRVWFLGQVPYPQFVSLLRVSAVHLYWTYPFVLSWSMLEAMACGCAVVASRTPPVEEVICHGSNGLLVDFFDVDGLIEAVSRVLERPDDTQRMREAARKTIIEKYDLTQKFLPQMLKLINQIINRRVPDVGNLPVKFRSELLNQSPMWISGRDSKTSETLWGKVKNEHPDCTSGFLEGGPQ